MNFIKIVFSLHYMHMIATDGSLHIIMTTCRYSCFFVPCIAIQLCNVNQQNAFCWL